MTPTEIIVHHSAGDDSSLNDTAAIRKYHKETLGWSDIGYNCLVEKVGIEYEALFGRPWDIKGAHTIGHNDHSLGICFVGNFELYEMPRQQLEVGAKVIRLWQSLYKIPKTAVFKHSDFNDTLCPGRRFPWTELLAILWE